MTQWITSSIRVTNTQIGFHGLPLVCLKIAGRKTYIHFDRVDVNLLSPNQYLL
jgi:hypothetical protein